MRRWVCIAVLLGIVPGWSSALAQSAGDIELGLDAGVNMAIVENLTLITVGFPVQSLRMGWFASDRLEVEPSVAFERQWASEGASALIDEQAGEARLAVSCHGGGAGSAGRAFVKAGGLIQGAKNVSPQFGVEAGIGWKQSIDSHWAIRVEVSTARTFDRAPLKGGWLPSFAFGLSHFSKPK